MNNAHKHIDPPKSAERFLSWFLKGELLEEILGDLYEYHEELLGKPNWKRKLFYWFYVLHFLRPFALKKSKSNNINELAMLHHFFKISWRNMLRHSMYSSIKIGGLSLGITACLLIALFIRHEMSYDQHYVDGDRIFRVLNEHTDPKHYGKWAAFPAPVAKVLVDNFPEIEKVGRLVPQHWFDGGENQFRASSKTRNIFEKGFAYADQEFLEILEIPMIYGDPKSALSEPMSIVISKSKADIHFPDENPVGQTVVLDDDKKNKTYVIGGVMQDFPSNAHLQFDFFLTLKGKEFWENEQSSWCCWNYNTYVRVRSGANIADLEEKLLLIRDQFIVPDLKSKGDVDAEVVAEFHRFELESVDKIYLRPDEVSDVFRHADTKIIILFGVVAGFILLLACINFINLSTAKSANRAKEVGLRKVVGSVRGQLISQFLIESMLFSFLAVVIGFCMAWVSLPYFNLLAGMPLELPWHEWWLFPGILVSLVLIGLLSGMYPSIYLSAFKPIEVLKGRLRLGAKSSKLRNSLVVFQFTASIVLIICTLVVYQQMQFILNEKVGFDRDQVVILKGADTIGKSKEPLIEALKSLSEVQRVSHVSSTPINGTNRNQNAFWKEGKQTEKSGVEGQYWTVDDEYIPTLGINLLEGRNFDKDMVSDSSAIIVNQAFLKKMGLKNPLGEQITNTFFPTFHIIGVIEDFHFETLKVEVGAMVLAYGTYGDNILVKINSESIPQTLGSISNIWEKFMPAQPIRYGFLDDEYERMYADVQRTGNIFTVFSLLAIIVACLGLFALSAFMVEQRTKEIGIRKVMGASVLSIFNLLTQNFMSLVLLACIVAMPIGGCLMNIWLEDYVYRIEVGWRVFAISGGLAAIIALVTISSESIKAGLENPAKSLRSE